MAQRMQSWKRRPPRPDEEIAKDFRLLAAVKSFIQLGTHDPARIARAMEVPEREVLVAYGFVVRDQNRRGGF